jgi:hypothetical protein
MNEPRTDIPNGLLSVAPSTDADFIEAFRLMDELAALPLRTLDALHHNCDWRAAIKNDSIGPGCRSSISTRVPSP